MSSVIGPGGGHVELAGVKLEIPPNALREAVTIGVRVEEYRPAQYEVVGSVYRFEPEGLSFAMPITVSMPGSPPDGSVVWSMLGASDRFEDLPTTLADGRATAHPTHFSRGFFGRPRRDAGTPPVDSGVPNEGGANEGGTNDDAGPSDGGVSAVACLAHLGGKGHDQVISAATDASGAVTFVGAVTGTIDFGGGVSITSRGNTREFFVAKVTRDCEPVFARTVGRAVPAPISLSPTGEVYMAVVRQATQWSHFELGTVPAGQVLVKLSATGTPLWQKSMSVGIDTLAATADGVVVLGRYSGSNATIDGQALPPPAGGAYAAFVAKLDGLGAHVWRHGFIGSDGVKGVGGAVGDAVYVNAACAPSTAVSFPDGTRTCPNAGAFVAKLASNGQTTVWMRDGLTDGEVAISPLGGLVLANRTTLTRVPDSATGPATWTKTLAERASGAPAVSPTGRVAVVAYVRSSAIDFGGGPVSPWSATGRFDGFSQPVVVEYADDGSFVATAHYRNALIVLPLFDPTNADLVVAACFHDRTNLGTGVLTSRYYDAGDIVVARRPELAPADPGAHTPSTPLRTAEGFATAASASGVAASSAGVVFRRSSNEIVHCPTSGCGAGPTVMSSGTTASNFFLASDALAVSHGGTSSTAGGVTCPFTTGAPCNAPAGVWYGGKVLVDAARLFWIQQAKQPPPQGPGPRELWSCPRADCTAPLKLGADLEPVISDATRLVASAQDALEGDRRALVRCAATDCTAPEVLAEGYSFAAVAPRLAPGGAFVFVDDGALYRCSLDGCAGKPEILAATLWGVGLGPVATTGSDVYFVLSGQQTTEIGKCPLTGCPATGPTILVGGVTPTSLAVDDTYIYWTQSDNKVYRALR